MADEIKKDDKIETPVGDVAGGAAETAAADTVPADDKSGKTVKAEKAEAAVDNAAVNDKAGVIFTWVSYIAGAVFGLVALVACLLGGMTGEGGAYAAISGIIYGLSMTVIFAAAALNQFLKQEKIKAVLAVIINCSAFIFIAGTYTPFALMILRVTSPLVGWVVLGITWAAAVTGIVLNVLDRGKYEKVAIFLYIAMVICIVLCVYQIMNTMKGGGAALLLSGIVVYAIGSFLSKMSKQSVYSRPAWHLVTVAGAVLQFLCILLYVL